MGVEFVGDDHVTDGKFVKLRLAKSPGAVDGEQDGPRNAAANETDDGENTKEAEKEEAVDGAVVDDVPVINGEEGSDPVEPAIRKRGSRVPAGVSLAKPTTSCRGTEPLLW